MMNEEQLSMYSAYMSTLGNREDLFPGSEYVDKYIENPPDDYTVNAAYLSDEKFATLLAEAEKYLGYPYVWGGSNPSTSFDCSGFVSYVLTNSGLVNTGRLGAQGLYNVCTPVSSSDAQPGDLSFSWAHTILPASPMSVSMSAMGSCFTAATQSSIRPSILPIGSLTSMPLADLPIKRKEMLH